MVTRSQLATAGCALVAGVGSMAVAGTSGYLLTELTSEPTAHFIPDVILFMVIVFLLTLGGFTIAMEDVVGVDLSS